MPEIVNEAEQAAHPMLDKIRKLLTKAERTDSDAEREMFNRKAAELAAKYGVDAAMAAASRPDGGADEMVLKEYEVNTEYAQTEASLLYWVMEGMGCKAILVHGDVHVVGYLADIEAAEVLYTSLSLQMAHGVVREVPDRSYSVRSRRRSWMLGFITAVRERLQAARKAAAEQAQAESTGGPGVDVVLADREVAVQSAFRQEFPVVRSGRRSRVDAGSYGAGHAAGQRANLGGTSVGGSGRAALAG